MPGLEPKLNIGSYVFCKVFSDYNLPLSDTIMMFRENEAITLILKKETADSLGLEYENVFAWITLNLQTGLTDVGLTDLFSNALSNKKISCNVVAAYYHDHIFVDANLAVKALDILQELYF